MLALDCYFAVDGPGAALGIALDGGDCHRECRGLADLPERAPITPRTAFDLASVSKVFTGAAVMLLEERGRLRIDDQVGRHVPMPSCEEGRPVTVRDLLWHTSGLPDYLSPEPSGGPLPLAPDAVLDRCREWFRTTRPGVSHEYSNTNYVLLAEVVAAASGTAYADFLRAELFEPFGMSETYVLSPAGRAAASARGYGNLGFGEPKYERSELDLPVVGDGGVFSSLQDLIRWQELFFGGSVISPAALARALLPGRLDDGTAFDYGCGLMLESVRGGRTWCGHTGGWSGAGTYLGRFVEERLSVVVLSNEQLAPVVRIAQRSLAVWRGRKGA